MSKTVKDVIERAEELANAAEGDAVKVETSVKEEVKKELPLVADNQKAPGEDVEIEQSIETVKPAEIDQKTGQLILTPKHKALIQQQIAKDATREELELFFMMAYRTRLDPLMKQLYFIKYKNHKTGETNVSYVTSIDGYRIIAHRTGDFGGIDEPAYQYDKNGKVTHCTVKVYRKSSDRPFSATVKFSEYNTSKNLWTKMPETMIAKVAEAHALRKAFPQDLSGIYTTDEMEQAQEHQRSEKMINKTQADEIVQLLKKKEKTKDDFVMFITRAFKKATIRQLTYAEANATIKKLGQLPDPIPVDVEEPPEDYQDGEVVLDMDEIDAGIEKMAKKPGAMYDESIQ